MNIFIFYKKKMDRQKKIMRILIVVILIIFLLGTFLSFISYLVSPGAEQQTGDIQELTGTGENITWTVATGTIITGENK